MVDIVVVVVVDEFEGRMITLVSGIFAVDGTESTFHILISLIAAVHICTVAPVVYVLVLNKNRLPASDAFANTVAETFSVRFVGMALVLSSIAGSTAPVSSNMHSDVYKPNAVGEVALLLCKPIS